jgi:hypothetical protein
VLDLQALANQWAISFAIGLAILVFVVKLFVHRRLSPIDLVAGIAEFPSDISAACLSLATAYLWLSGANPKLGSLAIIILALSFVLTTVGYRYIDDLKQDILSKPIRIVIALIASYLILYTLSIRTIAQVYLGVGE